MYVPTVADRVLGSAALRRRQALGRAIARTLGRVEVTGTQNLPERGPVVLVMNHRSAVDGVVLFGLLRRPITFLVKSEAFTPKAGPVLLSAGQIPVTRGLVDPAPIKLALRVLHGGGVVGVFPEGSRGDGLVTTTRPGAAYLALRSGAAVVPVAFHGTELLARGVHRPNVRIVLGPPIAVEQADPRRPLNRRIVAAEAERIRAVLAELVRTTDPAGKSIAA